MAKKNNKKIDTSEVDEQAIYFMTEGLTKDLIARKNEELMKEYQQLLMDVKYAEYDDDTEIYRGFIGHKLATLINVVEHLLSQNALLREAINEIDTNLAKMFPAPISNKKKKGQ